MIRWFLHFGKDPDRPEGYSDATVKNTAYRIDQFLRWVWSVEDGYTTSVTHDHADEYMRQKMTSDEAPSNKATDLKALKRLFNWLEARRGGERWDPEWSISGASASQPRDYLTSDERRMIREAALEYGSVPHYSSLTPAERDHWKTYLAQRFEKSKSDISPDDWERANGWKIPSLTWSSLDAGLRPVEVERASIQWVDVNNGALRIPADDSSKNRENWIVGLSRRTTEALDRWLDERELYEMYEDTDALWLTRQGNHYQSSSLRYLLHQLCELADIDTENRKMSWYSIRHSTGTYMTREEDLAAAQVQLRHKSEQTTMKYDQVPVEDRKNALDRMG